MPSPSMVSVSDCSGVLLRRSRGNYITAPNPLNHILLGAVMRLNLYVATTMRPQMLDGILASLTPGQTELKFKDGSQIQVLDSMNFAQLANIVPQATMIEEKLLSLVRGIG